MTMSGSACIRVFISGRVQGVGFRFATAAKARTLGITGYARNLADGRVEVLACGGGDAVAEFREWLNVGPAAAHVRAVSADNAAPLKIPEDFRIL